MVVFGCVLITENINYVNFPFHLQVIYVKEFKSFIGGNYIFIL